MRTISLQQMPNGFEIETPSFWYWMKAGIAFTLGAGAVYVAFSVFWLLLLTRIPELIMLRAMVH